MPIVSSIVRQTLVIIANLALTAAVTALIIFDLQPLALALVIISKWQVILGGVRNWWVNLLSNSCDLVVGVSFVVLIGLPEVLALQVGLAALYALWLLVIKPLASQGWVGVQALICQFLGLTVVFLAGRVLPGMVVIIGSWLVAVIAARHFLSAEEEVAQPLLVAAWGLLTAEFAWLLYRWLVTYPIAGGQLLVPQISLVVTLVGYFFGRIYLDHRAKRLSRRRLLEYVAVCLAVLAIIIVGTEWNVLL